MTNNVNFYRERADAERRNASEATLDNIRDRANRAAASWEAMAERAERVETGRQATAARKAEQI